MIAAYGIHGKGGEALKVFYQMVKSSGIKPNNVNFLSVLSACSYAGLVEKGTEIFDLMVGEYKLELTSEHYGIMVDLLGRNGEISRQSTLASILITLSIKIYNVKRNRGTPSTNGFYEPSVTELSTGKIFESRNGFFTGETCSIK
ncbi:hypothetical protein QYF36_003591 [Acer negundo]|nr:hypothetical protein QYF36_003591 [Acer negundo]